MNRLTSVAGLVPVSILNHYPSRLDHFFSGKASTIGDSTSSVLVKVSTTPKVFTTAFVWWAATHSGIVSHLGHGKIV